MTGKIAFVIMMVCVTAAALFYFNGCIISQWGTVYTDGWRYLPVLAIINVLFTVALLLYIVKLKWRPALFTLMLGIVMNLPAGIMPIEVSGLVICLIVLILLISFRKNFIYIE